MSRAGRRLVPRPDSDGGHTFSDPSAAQRCRWRPSSSSRHKQIHFSLASHVTCPFKGFVSSADTQFDPFLNESCTYSEADNRRSVMISLECFFSHYLSMNVAHSWPPYSIEVISPQDSLCGLFTGTEQRLTSAHVDPPCLQLTKASEEWKLSSHLNTINPNCLLNKLSQQLCLCAMTGHPSWWDRDNRDWEMKIRRRRVFNLFLGVITATFSWKDQN